MRRYLLFVSELYALPVLRPLQASIRARGGEAAWFFEKGGADHLHADERLLGSVPEVKAFRPDAVLVPGNWVPDYFPGLKVEVFHGFNVHKREDHRGHFRLRGFFDLYCTQGPHTTEPFRRLEAEHGYFRVVETGWPKMDPLFRPDPAPVSTPAGRPVVMYASTFTPSLSSAAHLLETVRELSREGRWHWLVTLHPKMDPEIVSRFRDLEGPNLGFFESDHIVSLYKAADVLLSDTSSVISEFILQARPVVTFRNRRPAPHMLDVSEPGEVEGAIAHALTHPDGLMQAVRAYADHIHPYRDGRSSERVLDAVEDALTRGRNGLSRKPLNLWRRVQARQRLGYWRLF
ncbi:MAG TPA: CDP-glycerol glycerophosphotransferase family protein [Gammaproteobacteria bacterium]|nr:CDP-glycerol glycerophosphotransferase family protein [Gammaproteobacteria bacterium]